MDGVLWSQVNVKGEDMATQNQVRDMVRAHVNENLTMLVMYLAKNEDHDYTEEIIQVMSKENYADAAFEADVLIKGDEFDNWWVLVEGDIPDGPYDSKDEALLAGCENNNVEPYIEEAYEWYAVTDWMAYQLQQNGEMVEDIFGMNIWGRAATGQAIYLDGVMEHIYDSSDKG